MWSVLLVHIIFSVHELSKETNALCLRRTRVLPNMGQVLLHRRLCRALVPLNRPPNPGQQSHCQGARKGRDHQAPALPLFAKASLLRLQQRVESAPVKADHNFCPDHDHRDGANPAHLEHLPEVGEVAHHTLIFKRNPPGRKVPFRCCARASGRGRIDRHPGRHGAPPPTWLTGRLPPRPAHIRASTGKRAARSARGLHPRSPGPGRQGLQESCGCC